MVRGSFARGAAADLLSEIRYPRFSISEVTVGEGDPRRNQRMFED